MQSQSWQAQTRPALDPLLILMAVGFIVAVGALAYPAFRSNPFSAPGLMLIFTAAAVAVILWFAFGRSEAQRPTGDVSVEMLDALAEPAALVWTSGQVLAFNAAWAEENGAMVTLPRGQSSAALYMAFAQAREGEQARAIVTIGAREIEVLIGRAGEGRFLVRAAPDAVLGLAHAPVAAAGGGASSAEGRAMAAGAPFGSAVIAHDDIFSGRIEEPNAALALLTGPASARNAAFGHLFEPNGVIEARTKLTDGSSGPIELVARAHPERMLHLYVAPEGDKRRIWLFDVSAQKSMELQLSQAQKMQAAPPIWCASCWPSRASRRFGASGWTWVNWSVNSRCCCAACCARTSGWKLTTAATCRSFWLTRVSWRRR